MADRSPDKRHEDDPLATLLTHIEDTISDEEWEKLDPALWNAVTSRFAASHAREKLDLTDTRNIFERNNALSHEPRNLCTASYPHQPHGSCDGDPFASAASTTPRIAAARQAVADLREKLKPRIPTFDECADAIATALSAASATPLFTKEEADNLLSVIWDSPFACIESSVSKLEAIAGRSIRRPDGGKA